MKKVYLLALAGSIACASGTGAGGAGTPRVPTDRNMINQLELESVAATNLYETIEKLRPNFLRSRGQASLSSSAPEYPSVYLDGRPYGDISSLRSIITTQVGMVRYYDTTAAAAKFGAMSVAGIIDVTTRQ